MSELALTLLRLGFLVLLWVGVLFTLSVLRRDLRAPAKPDRPHWQADNRPHRHLRPPAHRSGGKGTGWS